MKRSTKIIGGVAITIAALAAEPAVAHATPGNTCTPYNASAPAYDSICTGYGTACSLQLYGCSPVPGKPGTWNPQGYTACTYMNGCGQGYED